MREMIKTLLSACTVCAVGAALTAQADANPVPGQPIPPPPPGVPTSPAPQPVPSESPPTTPLPSHPGDQPTKPDAPSPGTPSNTPGTPSDTPGTPATTPTPGVPNAEPVANNPATTDVVPAPPVAVSADTTTDDDIDAYSYSWYEPELQSGIGVSATLGGGVSGFTDKTMRSTTSDLGGLWDLRVAIGSHIPLALEVGYVGTATNINGLPTGNKGRLIGTTVEGALRWNVLPHSDVTPYLFAGMGWQRYDVTNTSVSLADTGVASSDNLLVFPMGVGMAWRIAGFVADVRGTFRAATDNDLVLKTTPLINPSSSDFAPMHTWEASAAVGYEF